MAVRFAEDMTWEVNRGEGTLRTPRVDINILKSSRRSEGIHMSDACNLVHSLGGALDEMATAN